MTVHTVWAWAWARLGRNCARQSVPARELLRNSFSMWRRAYTISSVPPCAIAVFSRYLRLIRSQSSIIGRWTWPRYSQYASLDDKLVRSPVTRSKSTMSYRCRSVDCPWCIEQHGLFGCHCVLIPVPCSTSTIFGGNREPWCSQRPP